jgi:hypothetical protein
VSRRSIVVAAVLLAAIPGGLALLLWPPSGVPFRTTHSPLGPSSGWGPDADSPLFYRSVSQPFGDAKTNFVLRFRPHSRFRFDFDIQNRGRSPLRIDGLVPPSADSVQMVRFTRLLMQHKPQTFSFVGATAEPLTIEPGGFGVVVPVLETGGPCRTHYSAGSGEGTDAIHLRYSYRGVERTEWFTMPVVIGMVCGDPKPWIDNAATP